MQKKMVILIFYEKEQIFERFFLLFTAIVRSQPPGPPAVPGVFFKGKRSVHLSANLVQHTWYIFPCKQLNMNAQYVCILFYRQCISWTQNMGIAKLSYHKPIPVEISKQLLITKKHSSILIKVKFWRQLVN